MASKIVCMVMIISVVAMSQQEAGAVITCGRVLTSLSPCIGYVQRGGPVTASCCDGLKSLNDATRLTPDLQDACRCLKSLIPSVGANPNLVNGLPAKCGINFPYKYTPSLDCSKVVR